MKKLEILCSTKMSEYSSVLSSIEDKLIRVPIELREKFNIKTNDFVEIKGKNESIIILKVFKMYKEDCENNNAAYVSQKTYDLLNIQQKKVIKPTEDILIGGDPEFFLVNTKSNEIISAKNFFPYYGSIGNDCGLCELRPRPATNAKALLVNVKNLLQEVYNCIHKDNDNIKMFGASSYNNVVAGFHIHFGLPSVLLKSDHITQKLLYVIICILDYYVGIPSIITEDDEDYSRRADEFNTYGSPGDYRKDHMTLEYRVPGGHLLSHPVLAHGILAIATVVINDILSRIKMYSNNFSDNLDTIDQPQKFYPNLQNRKDVYDIIASKKTIEIIPYMHLIIKDISRMMKFNENKQAIIEYFSYAIDFLTNKKRYSKLIETNWELNRDAK